MTRSNSPQLALAMGNLKAAPLPAFEALSLKGSQQPGSRKHASHPSATAVRSNVPYETASASQHLTKAAGHNLHRAAVQALTALPASASITGI